MTIYIFDKRQQTIAEVSASRQTDCWRRRAEDLTIREVNVHWANGFLVALLLVASAEPLVSFLLWLNFSHWVRWTQIDMWIIAVLCRLPTASSALRYLKMKKKKNQAEQLSEWERWASEKKNWIQSIASDGDGWTRVSPRIISISIGIVVFERHHSVRETTHIHARASLFCRLP